MKIDLPENHPLAELIRDASEQGYSNGDRIFLSLTTLHPNGESSLLAVLEIDQWSKIRNMTTTMELGLTDVASRQAEIETLTNWPTLPEGPQ